jgi:23S rRNA (uracil1939-C5)-methyltransferase
VYSPAPLEIEDPLTTTLPQNCQHFPKCGGCSWRNLPYAEQLERKNQDLHTLFAPWTDLEIPAPLGASETDAWRSKIQLPIAWQYLDQEPAYGYKHPPKGLAIGCYATASHHVVDQKECWVQHPAANAVLQRIKVWAKAHGLTAYDEEKRTGLLRYIVLRHGIQTGEILVGIVTTSVASGQQVGIWKDLGEILSKLSLEANHKVVGLIQHISDHTGNFALAGQDLVRHGRGYAWFQLGKLKMRVGLGTFFQIHVPQMEKLLNHLQAWLPQEGGILDLYCGTGAIGLWYAQRGHRVCGLEKNPQAIAMAQLAAKDNGLDQSQWICGDAEKGLTDIPNFAAQDWPTWIVDPPRKGLSPALCQLINSEDGPQTLAYVSCNPIALARDAQILGENYTLHQIQGIDLFPHTDHLETLALLIRKK